MEPIPLPEKARIMVVDDEPIILRLMEDTLTKEGYELYTARSGREALKIINEAPVDMLITDIKMPEMDGLQLIEEVKGIIPEILIIVTTGYPQFDSALKSLKKGVYDYIVKPIDPDVVVATVRRGWERQRLAIKNRQLFLNLKRANEELQAAKAYTESIIQNFLDTLIVVDAEAKMQTMNPATCNLLGYTEEELIGQPIGVIFAEEEEARRFFQFFRGSEKAQALGPQDVIRNRELTCRAKDGRLIPMSFNASVITDEGGNVTGVVAGAKDITDLKQITEKITKINEELRAEITERKRLEAQLIHSTKMASLGVMASGIAHEIRNPLAVCSSAAQFLLENPHDRVLREQCADKIYSNVQRAARIIENLLKFARPSAADRGRVDLNETLEATLSLTENQIALQQIKLSRQFAEDLPPVIGSSSLLQQVFLNIIFNAANAMPGGGKLTISTLVNPEREAEVRFADTGCGIPQEHLDNIFDPFFTTMPVGRGTGLGLSVSYGIIQQHGGSIEVESSVGAGTTFTVKLPLRDAP